MKEASKFARFQVDARQVRSFLQIALPTCERKIVKLRRPAMLLGTDIVRCGKGTETQLEESDSIRNDFAAARELQPQSRSRIALQCLSSLQLPIRKKVRNVGIDLKLIPLGFRECSLTRLLAEFGGTSSVGFGEIER
jgi:hypothetical protein